MKIEKINDNQIRCTLTRADLASRQLKLSELICGTEKAKSFFQDMMKQASSEFGFEAEDMPLMIEAIPSSSDSIVLIITKVDDPEELDSKLSRFGSSPSAHDDKTKPSFEINMSDKLEGADMLKDIFERVKRKIAESGGGFQDSLFDDAAEEKKPRLESKGTSPKDPKTAKIRLFSFSSLDNVIRACQLLKTMYHGANTLYKDNDNAADKHSSSSTNSYLLVLTQSDHTQDEFFRLCNMMSEYGSAEPVNSAMLAFLEEHCEVLVSAEAVQQLGAL